MMLSFAAGAIGSLLLCLLFACTGWVAGPWQSVLTVLFAVLAVVFCGLTIWSVLMYRAFDYNGKRQMSRQIIEGVAAYIKLPQGGKCLDVGCGSGALAIAVAKRNPKADLVWDRPLGQGIRLVQQSPVRTQRPGGEGEKHDLPTGRRDAS